MQTIEQTSQISTPAIWVGRAMSAIVILFLVVDGAIKLVPIPIVTETMGQLGYPATESMARLLGVLTLVCTILYAIPRTSVLGAILLTGYLGGAMATHLRVGSPLVSHILFGPLTRDGLWCGMSFATEGPRYPSVTADALTRCEAADWKVLHAGMLNR